MTTGYSGINNVSHAMTHRIFNESGRAMSGVRKTDVDADSEAPSGKSFIDVLKESIGEVNDLQKNADNMAADVASGKSKDLHETMLASTQAELSFNLMIQIRNKVLDAYQEVMRLPV